MEPVRNIVVATDFSDCSDDAISVATELAVAMNATITIVHVWQLSATASLGVEDSLVDLLGPLEETARTELARDVKRVQRTIPTTVTQLQNGVAWEQILDVAKQQRADVLVIGTHGRTGLPHLLFGSVAAKLVRLSPCPVLTVPRRRISAEVAKSA
jgi:universal stress protein A